MAIDYNILKTEILTDPSGVGYGSFLNRGDDEGIAKLINTVSTRFPIDNTIIPSYLIVNNTAPTEWTALSANEKQRYQTITGAGSVDASNTNIRTSFTTMFSGGSITRANLIGLLTSPGSRAEYLFGSDIGVNNSDISKALRNT